MSFNLSDKKLSFALLCLANLAISFNFAALAAVVPRMGRDLLLPDVSVARILHYYMIPYGLGALIYAPLSRRMNFKTILAGTLLIYGAANVVCAFSRSLNVILLARILMGLAAASIIPLTLIIIGKFFERGVRGRLVGLFFSTSFIASVFGIALSGVADWPWLFMVPAILAVGGAALILLCDSETLSAKEEGTVDYGAVLRDAKVMEIFAFIFGISFLYHGVQKWFGVYFDRVYGFNQLTISFYFMLIAVSGAVGQNIGGYLTDLQGRYRSTLLGILILAGSTMLLLVKYSPWVLALVLCGFSVGWTIGHNGVSTVLTDMPEERRSEIASLNSAIRFFSGGLGFFAGGQFVEKNFGLTFFGFGLAMLCLAFFVKRIISDQRTAA